MSGKQFAGVLTVVLMRVFLGGVFAYAGFSKLMEPSENFQAAIADYGLIPQALHPVLARAIPWMEWLLGMFVLTGFNLRLSAGILGGVSAAFAVLIAASGRLSEPGNCGCFGEGGIQLTIRQMFTIDLCNVLFGAVLSRLKNHPLTLDRILRKPA